MSFIYRENPLNAIIRAVSNEQDYKAFAQLITEYVIWLRARYAQDSWFIREVLDQQALTNELEHLSTIYGAPNGRAFLASRGDEVRGCGAYRQLADGICEMKRVFVPPRFQGAGIGRRICHELVASARNDGFQLMRLDTGRIMQEAISLYESFGFKHCAPYHAYPERFMPYFVFMELPLVDSGADQRRRF